MVHRPARNLSIEDCPIKVGMVVRLGEGLNRWPGIPDEAYIVTRVYDSASIRGGESPVIDFTSVDGSKKWEGYAYSWFTDDDYQPVLDEFLDAVRGSK